MTACLPAGSLRESASQLRRANIIIFSKCPPAEVTPIMRRVMQNEVGLKPYQAMFFTTYEYGRNGSCIWRERTGSRLL
jgi:tetraacyldisaccharide 4'-kinase